MKNMLKVYRLWKILMTLKKKIDNLISYCLIKENRELKKQNIDPYKQK